VNLWVLAKYKKRMWLLWTVPTFSLLTCLAVWVYATAAEGWSGHERVKTVTILDQRNLTATTIGWAAFYAPITPGGGLTYAMSTELTPQIGRLSGRRYYGYGGDSGRPRTVNLDNGQHLATGWIVARVPAHFQVRKTADTVRRRLNFRGSAAAGFEVVNGLGVDVRRLVYADRTGKLYQVGAIPAGQTATLNARPGRAKAGHDAWRWIYENDWVGAGGTILDSAMACAVMSSVPKGSVYTTLEYKVNIIRPVPLGMEVDCIGVTDHVGRSTGIAHGEVRGVENGKLYATGSTTCIVMKI